MDKQQYQQSMAAGFLTGMLVVSATLTVTLYNAFFTPHTKPVVDQQFGQLPLHFIPNVGQAQATVAYQVQTLGGRIDFGTNRLNFFPTNTDATQPMELRFKGANVDSELSHVESHQGTVNYLIGNNPEDWKQSVPTYKAITYTNLYPGIDAIFDGETSGLKGTYNLAANADPALITWEYSSPTSAPKLEVIDQKLVITFANGVSITEDKPIAWQTVDGSQIPVEVSYVVRSENSVGFQLGSYRKELPLVIDPTIDISSYLGATDNETARAIAVDASGNVYVMGDTPAVDFPTTGGAYQNGNAGQRDLFITKVSSNGSTMLYSTYFGGSSNDYGKDIEVAANGNVTLVGETYSTNLPLQAAHQNVFYGNPADAFVTTFSPDGSSLVFSTYLGGSEKDTAYAVTTDAASNVYVTGQTFSQNYPLVNAYQSTIKSFNDAFLTKLSDTGAVQFSTLLGGYSVEAAFGVALDSSNNIYISGITASLDFPTQNPYQAARANNTDAFVSKFSNDGQTLLYSTYLGGNNDESAENVAIDSAGNIYLVGNTASTNFPLANAFVASHQGGINDVFVAKLNPTTNTLMYSSYYGGSGDDYAFGLAVNADNRAVVGGFTTSSNLLTVNQWYTDQPGNDAFILALDDAGQPTFSTYYGGSGIDEAHDIALVADQYLYMTGITSSSDFPVQNALQNVLGGGQDGFLVMANLEFPVSPITSPVDPSPTSLPVTPPVTDPDPSATPAPTPTPTPSATATPAPGGSSGSGSSGSSGSSGGGSGTGATTPATAPVCNASKPGTVSNLRITSTGANSISLAWNAANGADDYGVFFYRLSDNTEYGAASIGNVTSFSINGISGQAQYRFEVFAKNGCQPGDRVSVTSSVLTGPVLSTRPVSDAGQVLGATTEEVTPSPLPTLVPTPVATPRPTPQILGVEDSAPVCAAYLVYIPWIFLLAQLGILMVIEMFTNAKDKMMKYGLYALVTVGSIGLFYLLGSCDCGSTATLLGMLCTWYWLVSGIVSGVVRGGSEMMKG
jgi:hypothetical protein